MSFTKHFLSSFFPSPLYCSPAGLWKRGYLSVPTNKHWLVLQRRQAVIQRVQPELNSQHHSCIWNWQIHKSSVFLTGVQIEVQFYLTCFDILSSPPLYDRLCVGSLAPPFPGCSGQRSGDRSALGFRSLEGQRECGRLRWRCMRRSLQ